MGGSNDYPTQRNGRVGQQWPPESEDEARAREYERWLEQQRAEQAYHQGHAHQPPRSQAGPGHPQPGQYAPAHQPYIPPQQHGQAHHQQPQWGPDPLTAPPAGGHFSQPAFDPPPFASPSHGQTPYGDPSHGGQRAGYAPQFERYGTPQPSGMEHGQPYPGGPVERDHQGYGHAEPNFHDPRQQADHTHDMRMDPRQDPRTAPPFHGAPAQPGQRGDPGSYDLSHYATGQIPAGFGQAPQAQGWPQGVPAAQEAHWQQPAGGHWPQQGGDHRDPSGYHDPAGFQGGGHDPAHQFHADAGFGSRDGYEHEHAEVAQERRGPSTLVIVGALVGAIVAGSGLAYAYKTFGVGGKGKPPEIKANATPARTRPDTPGGKTIEYSDKAFPNRLASEAPVPTSLKPLEPTSGADGGPRKVSTTNIIINRDGTIAPDTGSGVPGLVIDGLGPPPAPAQSVTLPPPPPPARPALPPPPAVRTTTVTPPPRVADLPLPKVRSSGDETVAAAPARVPVPKRSAVRDDFAAPKSGVGAATEATATAPPRRPTGANGYVAVLASTQNRQASLSSFADLFQKYPEELAGRTPDVREANLGSKGIWYRLIAGPPGSRQAANELCSKLRQRGFKDCFPVAY